MHTLLLRLSGPMQSWGVQGRVSVVSTGLEPSKSGVVGLLCAALGRSREAPVADLAALGMGVRVDQEGVLQRDFHTAGQGGFLRARGTIERRNVIVTTRYYLADARFLVGLASEDRGLLARLYDALRNPHWPLYLGRKAFVPGEPVWLEDGFAGDTTLLRALASYPWLGPAWAEPPEEVRAVIEDPAGPELHMDQPLSFAERRFAPRRTATVWLPGPVGEWA